MITIIPFEVVVTILFLIVAWVAWGIPGVVVVALLCLLVQIGRSA
jgi:hypothetical protein